MNVLVLTSNQRRHAALVRTLQQHHKVVTIIEPKSFFHTSARYWSYVDQAERVVFGDALPLIDGPTLPLLPGEVSRLASFILPLIEDADRVVVFSSSYLTGDLADLLVAKGALNLHAGIAPEYRGSAPNFWAEWDGHPELVGAQVQRLSRGLDAGEILDEVRVDPTVSPDPFLRGMIAVQRGIAALAARLHQPEPWTPVRTNDPSLQRRFAAHMHFTTEIAMEYLERIGR